MRNKEASTKGIDFGFVSRKGTHTKKKRATNSKKSVFNNNSESDSESSSSVGNERHFVNRALVAEQALVREKTVAAAAVASSSSDLYDYDGQYDSFSSDRRKQVTDAPETKKESRYIGKLLEHAKNRQLEHETILERKVAREQAEEEAKGEYVGKEKFVTSAYKQKIIERDAWLKEDEKIARKEKKEDVTKVKGGSGALTLGFYKNLSKNVSMGGGQRNTRAIEEIKKDDILIGLNDDNDESGRIRANDRQSQRRNTRNSSPTQYLHDERNDTIHFKDNCNEANKLVKDGLKVRRMQKIFEARKRYLKRQGKLGLE